MVGSSVPFDTPRPRAVGALTLGHLTLDSYTGVIPVLYPVLLGRFDLDLGQVGLLFFAYAGMSALSQPFFGLVADRIGIRLVGGTLVWTAAWFGTMGLMPTWPTVLAAAAIAGLGSGFFHPLGALSVRRWVGGRKLNATMALYVSGGSVGFAMGPLAGIAVLHLLGLRGVAVLIVPAALCGTMLLLTMRAGARRSANTRPQDPLAPAASLRLGALAAVVVVMMARNWTVSVIEGFVPTWYHQLGYQPWFYGPLATIGILAGAAGTIGCGRLADRWGRRPLVLWTLVLSVPALALFVAFPGPQAFVTATLTGLLTASTIPLMLTMAQELLAARAGLASGLVLGLGFASGAVGVPVTGMLADHIGLQAALFMQIALILATIPVALALPGERGKASGAA